MVQAKQVGWVVLALERRKAIIVGTVSSLDTVFTLFADIVDVSVPLQEGLHRIPELAHPLDILGIVCRVEPDGDGQKVVVGGIDEERLSP